MILSQVPTWGEVFIDALRFFATTFLILSVFSLIYVVVIQPIREWLGIRIGDEEDE